jgi:hypothetical protein
LAAAVRRGWRADCGSGATGQRDPAELDRLDEAFLYSESIDLATYSRQRDKLREELTLSKIDTTPRPSTNST